VQIFLESVDRVFGMQLLMVLLF